MERQLRQILEAGLHATLNAGLRRLAGTQDVRPGAVSVPHRLLLGSHDVGAFTAKMARWPAVRDLVAALAADGQAPDTASCLPAARWLQQAGPRRWRRAG